MAIHNQSESNELIDVQDLTKMYYTDELQTTALCDVNLTVNRGEFVAIAGPSGCGKSTLLHILGLLDTPTKGSYRFGGQEVPLRSSRQRSLLRRNNIGFVFQAFNLIDELTVAANVELPLLYLHKPQKERHRLVKEVVDRLGIDHRLNHYPTQLSGGQQQRVAVARALVAAPELILADEPTGNLDTKNGHAVMELMKEINSGGTTVVIVTHSQEYAEAAGRVIHLRDGQITASEKGNG